MIYLKFVLAAVGKLLLLPTVPFAAVLISIFTRPHEGVRKPLYTWGWIWGTFDNDVKGDNGYITKHAPFPNIITGWRGYINRVMWMIRNPLYNYSRAVGIDYSDTDVLKVNGNPDISDKYKVAGWMWATLSDTEGKLKAFEWYSVTPWSTTRNLRIRLGWKIKTEKMQERGWARHVVTINPLDGYGA